MERTFILDEVRDLLKKGKGTQTKVHYIFVTNGEDHEGHDITKDPPTVKPGNSMYSTDSINNGHTF